MSDKHQLYRGPLSGSTGVAAVPAGSIKKAPPKLDKPPKSKFIRACPVEGLEWRRNPKLGITLWDVEEKKTVAIVMRLDRAPADQDWCAMMKNWGNWTDVLRSSSLEKCMEGIDSMHVEREKVRRNRRRAR